MLVARLRCRSTSETGPAPRPITGADTAGESSFTQRTDIMSAMNKIRSWGLAKDQETLEEMNGRYEAEMLNCRETLKIPHPPTLPQAGIVGPHTLQYAYADLRAWEAAGEISCAGPGKASPGKAGSSKPSTPAADTVPRPSSKGKGDLKAAAGSKGIGAAPELARLGSDEEPAVIIMTPFSGKACYAAVCLLSVDIAYGPGTDNERSAVFSRMAPTATYKTEAEDLQLYLQEALGCVDTNSSSSPTIDPSSAQASSAKVAKVSVSVRTSPEKKPIASITNPPFPVPWEQPAVAAPVVKAASRAPSRATDDKKGKNKPDKKAEGGAKKNDKGAKDKKSPTPTPPTPKKSPSPTPTPEAKKSPASEGTAAVAAVAGGAASASPAVRLPVMQPGAFQVTVSITTSKSEQCCKFLLFDKVVLKRWPHAASVMASITAVLEREFPAEASRREEARASSAADAKAESE